MFHRSLTVFLTILSFLVATGPAFAAGRVALVVGNSNYQHVAPLKNPRNDAQDVGAALQRLGFEVVIALDLTRQGFKDALQDFERRSSNSEIALFFYAGQGSEDQGKNWLVPVDAKIGPNPGQLPDGVDLAAGDISREMQALDDVLSILQRAPGIRIALIDACRTAWFGPKRGFTTSEHSLSRVEALNGMMIVMSTSPGQEALDGEGRNSPFATSLLAHIETADLEIGLVMQRVASDVVRETRGQQQPYITQTAFSREVYFKRSSRPPLLNEAETKALSEQEAEKAWEVIRSTNDRERLRSFVITFPRSQRANQAFVRLEELAIAERLKPAPADTPQKRVALVIGNGKYQYANELRNPKSDAGRVAAALERLGFQVQLKTDLAKRQFDAEFPDFGMSAKGADIALVYFAGHAMEVDGAAYVMPADANPISPLHVRNQLKSVHDIVRDLEYAAGLKLIVVDGCRDNPLAAKLFGILGAPRTTGPARGHQVAEPDRQRLGEVYVVFSTLSGKPAYDGGGTEPNSPFTAAFLRHIETGGLDLNQLFEFVTADVIEATSSLQRPQVEKMISRSHVLHAGPRPTASSK